RSPALAKRRPSERKLVTGGAFLAEAWGRSDTKPQRSCRTSQPSPDGRTTGAGSVGRTASNSGQLGAAAGSGLSTGWPTSPKARTRSAKLTVFSNRLHMTGGPTPWPFYNPFTPGPALVRPGPRAGRAQLRQALLAAAAAPDVLQPRGQQAAIDVAALADAVGVVGRQGVLEGFLDVRQLVAGL